MPAHRTPESARAGRWRLLDPLEVLLSDDEDDRGEHCEQNEYYHDRRAVFYPIPHISSLEDRLLELPDFIKGYH